MHHSAFLFVWLAGLLVGWLVGQMAGWLVVQLAGWSVGSLVGWLDGSLVGNSYNSHSIIIPFPLLKLIEKKLTYGTKKQEITESSLLNTLLW